MQQERKPWDYHQDLKEEHLQLLAWFFGNTAAEVAANHLPESGDDSWSLGCRRNAWWRNRLLEIDRSGAWPWFSIVSPTKAFVFAIGNVPVRFYRGRLDNPPRNTLAHRDDELRQLSLAFPDSKNGEMKWRFSIETNGKGKPVGVVFAGLKEDGTVACYWNIPFEADVVGIYTPVDAVEIESPAVEFPGDKEIQAGWLVTEKK